MTCINNDIYIYQTFILKLFSNLPLHFLIKGNDFYLGYSKNLYTLEL